ncbi:MAG TPA: sugar ABC transporter permease [Chloroflexota bacterium]|nr:sugar ABC transporter permease [Chloroflexota bacterium]
MTSSQRWVPYAFLLPALIGLLAFRIVPTFYAVGRSLYATSFVMGPHTIFVGSDNYTGLFSDPTFWQSVKVTLLFNAIINPLQTALALFLAILVSMKLKGVGIFRSIFFIPISVSLPVASIVWAMMLDSQSGLINGILVWAGLPAQAFLASTTQAMPSIILIASWIGVGYWMFFFLAGLQGIPPTIYEAAAIDGASAVAQFLYVTLPLLRRVIAFVLVADTTANFLLFAPVYILTHGGPQGSTDFLMYEAYRNGFMGLDVGRATSITTILLFSLLLVVGMELLVLRRDE